MSTRDDGTNTELLTISRAELAALNRKRPDTAAGYHGEFAETYEPVRAQQRAWAREHRLVDRWCRHVPRGSTVLDVPCGTGRLVPIFERWGLKVYGGDVSDDMMRQIPHDRLRLGALQGLSVCDAANLPFTDRSFDYVVSLRLFHLNIPLIVQERMLREFMRTARRGVLLHLVTRDRPLTERAADVAWRGLRQGHQLPAHVVRKALGIAGASRSRESGPLRRWRSGDLRRVVEDAGFTLRRLDGASTPFSAKKLCVIERIGVRGAGSSPDRVNRGVPDCATRCAGDGIGR